MSPARKRDIFISSVQFEAELKSGAVSVLDLAPIAARLGVQGVEYREVYWKDKAAELPAARDQLANLGLKVTYATFTTLYNRDPARQQQLMQDLEDARALGSPLMRVFRGEHPGEGPESMPTIAAAQATIDRAGSYGMKLALENYRAAPGNRLLDVQETLQRHNSPHMGANLDTSNYTLNDQDIVEAIHSLAPWIMYCHLKDARQTPAGLKETYMGNGFLPIPEIIAALDATGRDFPLCFEFRGEGDTEGSILKSLEYLARL